VVRIALYAAALIAISIISHLPAECVALSVRSARSRQKTAGETVIPLPTSTQTNRVPAAHRAAGDGSLTMASLDFDKPPDDVGIALPGPAQGREAVDDGRFEPN
jgi:hypothetical protein